MKRRVSIGILLLGLILITATACGSDDKETTSQQPTESDANVTVTGDGNIEASSHERLTFGSGGKVDKVCVKEGDKVNKGDVLARLDTSALELAEAQAQVALTQVEVTLASQQVAVTEAEVELKTAEYNLDQAMELYTWPEIKVADADVDDAEAFLEYVLDKGLSTTTIVYAQARLDAAQARLDAMITDYDTEEVALEKMKVGLAEQSLELAEQSLEHAQQNVNLAQKSLNQAKKDLEEATIIAPFDGMVANIGVKEGEFLSPAAYIGTTIVELIDTRHMELTARVDELDVVKVKTGQKVMISVDAIPEMKLEGWVTFISPVAREPGVVLFEDEDEEKEYEVKIDFNISGKSPIRAGMSATAEIIIE